MPRGEELTEEWVARFDGYAREAYDYLGVLRDRLFSEGVVIRNLDNEMITWACCATGSFPKVW